MVTYIVTAFIDSYEKLTVYTCIEEDTGEDRETSGESEEEEKRDHAKCMLLKCARSLNIEPNDELVLSID